MENWELKIENWELIVTILFELNNKMYGKII